MRYQANGIWKKTMGIRLWHDPGSRARPVPAVFVMFFDAVTVVCAVRKVEKVLTENWNWHWYKFVRGES